MNNRTLDFEGKVGVYNTRSLESEAEALQIETQLKLISYSSPSSPTRTARMATSR